MLLKPAAQNVSDGVRSWLSPRDLQDQKRWIDSREAVSWASQAEAQESGSAPKIGEDVRLQGVGQVTAEGFCRSQRIQGIVERGKPSIS